MKVKFWIFVLMFIIGALAGSLGAFIVVAFAVGKTALAVMVAWPGSAFTFGWWWVALAGGAISALGYVVRMQAYE